MNSTRAPRYLTAIFWAPILETSSGNDELHSGAKIPDGNFLGANPGNDALYWGVKSRNEALSSSAYFVNDGLYSGANIVPDTESMRSSGPLVYRSCKDHF
ncbi:hypothetical protein QE152_g13142 [Popillia japonica]|uniref:Uncharacterized protein n=1 Tax=Popillia japonica TaxID=7064 RepID=A0AAW1LBX2_POPJA